jgi:sensor histidine kinase YesM
MNRLLHKMLLILIAILLLTTGSNHWISAKLFYKEYSKVMGSEILLLGKGLEQQLERLLAFDIKLEELAGFDELCRDAIEHYPEVAFTAVIDREGRVLFSSEETPRTAIELKEEAATAVWANGVHTLSEVEIDERKYDIGVVPVIGQGGWTAAAVVIAVPANYIAGKIRAVTNDSVLLSLVFFLTSFGLIVAALNRWVARPLENMNQTVTEASSGNLNARTTVSGKDEFARIGSMLNRMLGRMQELIDETAELVRDNYKKQLLLKETEYRALQAQINPHFLYNTLESINWMAKVGRQPNISQMVEALGRLLRDIAGNRKPVVAIEEELRIVHCYVTIQQIRFGKRLTYDCKTEPSLDTYRIPKLSIQPIVENAIHHALEVMEEPCRLELVLRAGERGVEIEVRDNGPGIPPELLAMIQRGDAVSKGSGIGIANIRERIRLMYGDDYGVTVRSEFGVGTTVTIRIPYCTEDTAYPQDERWTG